MECRRDALNHHDPRRFLATTSAALPLLAQRGAPYTPVSIAVFPELGVGRKSTIPNISRYRTDAVEYLKALEIPPLRWPGRAITLDLPRPSVAPARVRI